MNDPTRPEKYRISQWAAHITPFRGERKPQVVNEYIRSVQPRFADHFEDQRLLIEYSVGGAAQTWLQNVMKRPDWHSMSGDDVLNLLREAYFPANYAEATIRGITTLTRGKNTLAWYLEEFMRMKEDIPDGAVTDISYRTYLIVGVGEPYASDLRRQNFTTFIESFEYLQRQVNTVSSLPNPTATYSHWPDAMEIDHVETTTSPWPADISVLSRAEINAINTRIESTRACWYCHKNGHIQRNCPNRRKDNSSRETPGKDNHSRETPGVTTESKKDSR